MYLKEHHVRSHCTQAVLMERLGVGIVILVNVLMWSILKGESDLIQPSATLRVHHKAVGSVSVAANHLYIGSIDHTMKVSLKTLLCINNDILQASSNPVLENGIYKGCKMMMVLYHSSRKGFNPDKANWVMQQSHLISLSLQFVSALGTNLQHVRVLFLPPSFLASYF